MSGAGAHYEDTHELISNIHNRMSLLVTYHDLLPASENAQRLRRIRDAVSRAGLNPDTNLAVIMAGQALGSMPPRDGPSVAIEHTHSREPTRISFGCLGNRSHIPPSDFLQLGRLLCYLVCPPEPFSPETLDTWNASIIEESHKLRAEAIQTVSAGFFGALREMGPNQSQTDIILNLESNAQHFVLPNDNTVEIVAYRQRITDLSSSEMTPEEFVETASKLPALETLLMHCSTPPGYVFPTIQEFMRDELAVDAAFRAVLLRAQYDIVWKWAPTVARVRVVNLACIIRLWFSAGIHHARVVFAPDEYAVLAWASDRFAEVYVREYLEHRQTTRNMLIMEGPVSAASSASGHRVEFALGGGQHAIQGRGRTRDQAAAAREVLGEDAIARLMVGFASGHRHAFNYDARSWVIGTNETTGLPEWRETQESVNLRTAAAAAAKEEEDKEVKRRRQASLGR